MTVMIKTAVVIGKLRNIIVGWGKRLGILQVSTAEAKLSQLRLKECSRCIFSKQSKVLELLNGNATYTAMLYCKRCSCPCLEKTLVVDEKCPINRW
jgi:hypothetical protein